jgi:hypothetical protein
MDALQKVSLPYQSLPSDPCIELGKRIRELGYNETLLCCAMKPSSGCFGVLCLVFGVGFLALTILNALMNTSHDVLALTIFFSLFTVTFLQAGLFFTLARNNYYFVTNKRLCIRGRSYWGWRIKRDIAKEEITDVTVDSLARITVRTRNGKKARIRPGLDEKLMAETLRTFCPTPSSSSADPWNREVH